MNTTQRVQVAGLVLLASLAGTSTTLAGPSRHALDPLYRTECGSCHVAYPPALLEAASWRKVLEGLDHHFGSDATVDPATKASLAKTLQRDVRPRAVTPSGDEPRITATPWFRREHHEVASAAFASPAVRSPANCEACHPGAAHGDYAEDAVRMPVAGTRNR